MLQSRSKRKVQVIYIFMGDDGNALVDSPIFDGRLTQYKLIITYWIFIIICLLSDYYQVIKQPSYNHFTPNISPKDSEPFCDDFVAQTPNIHLSLLNFFVNQSFESLCASCLSDYNFILHVEEAVNIAYPIFTKNAGFDSRNISIINCIFVIVNLWMGKPCDVVRLQGAEVQRQNLLNFGLSYFYKKFLKYDLSGVSRNNRHCINFTVGLLQDLRYQIQIQWYFCVILNLPEGRF